jgi:hypothetical protein
MHAGPAFIAQIESTKLVQPGQRSFDDPARAAQPAAVRAAALRQLAGNAASLKGVAMRLRIVPPVPLHEGRLPQRAPRATAHRGNPVDQRQQLGYVVSVRGREARDDRNPVRVGKNMMFRPGLTAIGRVRSSFFPPRSARSEVLSTTARARSSWPRWRNSSSSTRWSRFQTPARCQRTRRRQHVVPDPHPICGGSMFQGMPLRSTNRMPVKTARSGIGLRPAYRRLRGRRLGSNGSSRAHRPSSIRGLAMSDRLATGQAKVPSHRSKYKRLIS